MTALRRAVIHNPHRRRATTRASPLFSSAGVRLYLRDFLTLMPGSDARIYVLAATDLAFVVSVFLMGGEFWEKVRRIFVYEGRI